MVQGHDGALGFSPPVLPPERQYSVQSQRSNRCSAACVRPNPPALPRLRTAARLRRSCVPGKCFDCLPSRAAVGTPTTTTDPGAPASKPGRFAAFHGSMQRRFSHATIGLWTAANGLSPPPLSTLHPPSTSSRLPRAKAKVRRGPKMRAGHSPALGNEREDCLSNQAAGSRSFPRGTLLPPTAKLKG